MKKVLISLGVIAFVGAAAVGATGAFFSDTETSTGNTFTAGAIDLKIDNESYYNGVLNKGTTWLEPADLDGHLFFDFSDLKPGDWGEDTISIHVDNNDAYACLDVRLDSDDDNTLTEPETPVDPDGLTTGELADHVSFMWWVDDGDNVWEDNELLLESGPLGLLGVGNVATVPLAEPNNGGIFGGALEGERTYWIGKYWCFGKITQTPVPAGQGVDPTVASGFECDGSGEGNETQTDSMTATISFMAEQARNNDDFRCVSHLPDGEGPQG